MGTEALTPEELRRWTHVGALAAVALLLGYLETFLPLPIPGIKLGLANVAVLVAFAQGDPWGACCVALVKVLAAGLLFGSPVTMAYSTAGTALSLLVMAPLLRLRTMRLWMASVVGGIAHEAGQLAVAQLLLGTPLVWYGAPPLLLAGCITGALCGLVAERATRLIEGGGEQPSTPSETLVEGKPPSFGRAVKGGRIDPRLAIVALVAFAVATLRLATAPPLLIALELAAFACIYAHVTAQEVLRALVPVAFICAITLVAQVLSTQEGDILFMLGGVAVTHEAFARVGVSALRLVTLVAASTAFVRLQSTDELLQGVRWLLSPLRACGARIEGPLLALDIALRLLPLLASGAANLGSTLREHEGLRGAIDALPQLVAHAYHLADELERAA